MARSLDELVDFLLDEIALDQGASLQDIVHYTKYFYAQPCPAPPSSSTTPQITTNRIDRKFVGQLWKWLARHDDLCIGKRNEYKNSSLDEIEVAFPELLTGAFDPLKPVGLPSNDQGSVKNILLSRPAAIRKKDVGPRVIANQDRVYYAVCGHEPDPTRVSELELSLLRAIGAARNDGILQGELGRITKQDKRSVPKRTDALHEKGYVVKQLAYHSGHKTSRIFLRRFIQDQINPSEAGSTLQLRDLARQILNACHEYPFITQDDLAQLLNISNSSKRRIFDQIIKHLVRRECLKKVKTAFAPDSATNDLTLTLQFVRELEDADLAKKEGDLVDLETHLDTAVELLGEADINLDEVTREIEKDSDVLEAQSSAILTRPSWNPDRSFANTVHDLAVLSGDHGMTNLSVRQQITGLTVKRPVESMLVRLSRSALKAQPLNIHDLALVRTTEGGDGFNRFVHRSLEGFSQMVDRGELTWSAANGGYEFAKRIGPNLGSGTTDMSQRDDFGFAKRTRPGRQLNDGRVALEDVANVPGPDETVILRPGEAAIVTDAAGAKVLSMKPETVRKAPRRSKTPKRLSYIVVLKLKSKSMLESPQATVQETEPTGRPADPLAQQSKSIPKTPELMPEQLQPAIKPFESTVKIPDPILQQPKTTLQQPQPVLQAPEPIREPLDPILQEPDPTPQQPELIIHQHDPTLKQSKQRLQKPKSISKKPEPKKKQNGNVTKTLGRPRKFLQGTEEYWQILFWIKRYGSDLEVPSTTKETGLMRDPDCLKMFADRPKNFDETLVKALEQELPVPRTPAGITDTWVSKVNEFLDRKGVGAFYVPSGMSDLRQSEWSCPIIIRSTRLGEIDVSGRRRPASILFLASSAAHSFHHHRGPQRNPGGTGMDAQAGAVLTTGIDKSANQALQIVTTGKEGNGPRSEKGVGPARTVDEPLIENAIVKNSLAVPDQQPIPAHPAKKPPASATSSTRKPTALQGRAQRRRRPTQKALESAQSCLSNGSDAEVFGKGGAIARDTYINSEVLEASPPSFSEKQFSSTDVTPAKIAIGPATAAVGISADDLQTRRLLSPQTTSSEPSNLKLSENEAHHASHPFVSEPAQQTPGQKVETEIQSSRSTQVPSTPTMLAEADARPRIELYEDLQEIDIGATNSNDPAGLEPESSQPPDSNTGQEVDPAPFQVLVGRDAVPYYKKFLIELVYMCGGVVPHDPSLLKRAMGPKTIEAHVESNMNIKLIKSCISQLTQNGKLKNMKFGFQRNGFNHTKAIIALPNTQLDDQVYLAMQTKISLLPADVDYVPPELEREANRKPQGILRHPDSPLLGAKTKTKRVVSAKPKRQKNQPETRSRRASSALSRQPSLSPGPPEISINTGFLTLKVPGIDRIQTDNAFTSNYFGLPAQPLILNTFPPGGNTQTSAPGPSSAQRNGVRKPRRSAVNGNTRTIQWRVPKRTPLPKSLKAILAYDCPVVEIDHSLSVNPALEAFDKDVDFVTIWEQKHFDDLQEPKPREWNFINHLSNRKEFIDTRREGDLQFRQINFDALHEEVETDLPEAESWDVFAEIVSKEASKSKRANARNKLKRQAQTELVDGRSNDEDEEGLSDFRLSGEEHRRKRQKGPTQKRRRKPRVAGTDKDRRRQRRNHINPRGIGLRDIPKELAHRITTAIVVVRVLTGGLDKYLDWKLVARLIPGEPESMLQSRWRTLSTRYNNDFDAMVQDLQTKYLDALADDKVPSVNYDDLHGTNWEGIHAWAIANINAEFKSVSVIELPPNRDEFLELNTAEVAEPISVRHLHNISLQYTQTTREDFWCSVLFGTSAESLPVAPSKHIEPSYPVEDDEANILHARARSWVFAAVVTPHQSFNPQSAHEKLRRLAENERECEQLIESTLKKLRENKMVVSKDSADAVVERNGSTLSGTYEWKLSMKFLDRFETNRYITPKMLKLAVQYKIEILDPSFARGEPVVIPGDPLLEDGVMITVFNLMNTGMLQLEPGADMPATRYGIDGESEGYQTRSMDKKNLFFSTILKPTSTYVLGDLSMSKRCHVAIPRGDMDREDGLGLIPIWFDINQDFRRDIWDMTVGSITGLISCQPGVSTIQLVRTLDHILSQKDLGMITQYLFDCGMIERTCTGWETTETWWFALGTGNDIEIQNGV